MSRQAAEIEVKVCRAEGADGQVSCMIRTEAVASTQGLGGVGAAEAGVHFEALPSQKVLFRHGETEKVVPIKILKWEDAPAEATQG